MGNVTFRSLLYYEVKLTNNFFLKCHLHLSFQNYAFFKHKFSYYLILASTTSPQHKFTTGLLSSSVPLILLQHFLLVVSKVCNDGMLDVCLSQKEL